MANSPEQEKVMNAAADKLLVESKPYEGKAIGCFVDLIDKHYLEAGYRRVIERSRSMRPVMK